MTDNIAAVIVELAAVRLAHRHFLSTIMAAAAGANGSLITYYPSLFLTKPLRFKRLGEIICRLLSDVIPDDYYYRWRPFRYSHDERCWSGMKRGFYAIPSAPDRELFSLIDTNTRHPVTLCRHCPGGYLSRVKGSNKRELESILI